MVGMELIVFVYFFNFVIIVTGQLYKSNLLLLLLDEDSAFNDFRKNLLSESDDNLLVRRLSKSHRITKIFARLTSSSPIDFAFDEFGKGLAPALSQLPHLEPYLKWFPFQLPFTNQLKSDAWFKILRYQSVETLDVTQWRRYESIIPNIPISMLRKVNFTDESILQYFGQQKLTEAQFAQIADEVSVRGDVLANKEKILALGNIFCGFPASDLENVKESTLRYLLEKGFFQSLKICGFEQLSTLARIIVQRTIIGPPITWKPETVKKAGSLIAGLQPRDIREISDRSFSEISSQVIDLTPVETLREFKNSHLKTLKKSALLAWRRKTHDFRRLYTKGSSGCLVKISFRDFITAFLVANFISN